MAHCPYEKLWDLESGLDEVRSWSGIREPKPGIFYFKSRPFLHFHIKADERWADVRSDGNWESINASIPLTAKQTKSLAKQIKRHHKKLNPNL